jgi:hypothetical protein
MIMGLGIGNKQALLESDSQSFKLDLKLFRVVDAGRKKSILASN